MTKEKYVCIYRTDILLPLETMTFNQENEKKKQVLLYLKNGID